MKKNGVLKNQLNSSKIEILNDELLTQIKGGDLYLQSPRGSNNRIDEDGNG